MTEDEARTVAEIVMSADGGCFVCTGSLIACLVDAFPEHADLFGRIYNETQSYALSAGFAEPFEVTT